MWRDEVSPFRVLSVVYFCTAHGRKRSVSHFLKSAFNCLAERVSSVDRVTKVEVYPGFLQAHRHPVVATSGCPMERWPSVRNRNQVRFYPAGPRLLFSRPYNFSAYPPSETAYPPSATASSKAQSPSPPLFRCRLFPCSDQRVEQVDIRGAVKALSKKSNNCPALGRIGPGGFLRHLS